MVSKSYLVRCSRDGDQFHYLWAARRCLQLLRMDGDLLAISIEGVSQHEQIDKISPNSGEEVIDIAEYWGHEDIYKARLVRYMQLKHSTLHATEPWTASGLEKTIKGFAQRYNDLLKIFSPDDLATKFQFWFVTNRPIDTDITEALTDAATGVVQRHPKELKKLERFTGLRDNSLLAFLKLLHFEDRQDDYWEQRNILSQDTSEYLPGADANAPIQLKELVTRRALSEGRKNLGINKMDVLRALGTEEYRLFPAPCLIERVDSHIPRSQDEDIMRMIIPATVPVVVHASAGVGKTVFATRIKC